MTEAVKSKYEQVGPILQSLFGDTLPAYLQKHTMDTIDLSEKILSAANQRVEHIVSSAEAHADATRQEAYREGQVAAAEDAARMLMAAERARQAFLNAARQELESSAVSIARVLVGRSVELDPAWLEDLLSEYLKSMRVATHVDVLCHPDDEQVIEGRCRQSGLSIHVITDEGVSRGGFLIRSDLGRVDATVEGRLQVLLDSLAAVDEP